MKGVDLLIQVTKVLHKSLEDEEKLLAEVQRDKDRFDQRQKLEEQVHDLESIHFHMAAIDGTGNLVT